ncbi:YifB family Mg chelatase-like AAA ATPase [bacterium]|nr:YifB family Mg chelatase-like AAA ATPase [bacterium]
MFARVLSGGVLGVDAYGIDVEVDCCGGIGQMNIVGLPDLAVRESQDRVRAAIRSCSLILPSARKWIINLAPADTRKAGPLYDLPIAAGILASSGLASMENFSRLWMVGELGLNGAVRPVSGVLPLALKCKQSGARAMIVPEANAMEASLVEGLEVYPVGHLKEALMLLDSFDNGQPYQSGEKFRFDKLAASGGAAGCLELDFREVKGQLSAKRSMEIAAAGRHNLLLVGPPGSGKSMLAERLPGIMPPLSYSEALELTKLYSVAGLLDKTRGLITARPFRSPHHSSSVAGLVGGGLVPRPGEISLSHYGILFLDELTEFSRSHLDNLRQPLETGNVTISRSAQTLTFPASFLFVGACNPCPCGHRGDPVKYCICSPYQADRYWSRLSGPILDRIDMQVEVPRLREHELSAPSGDSSSEEMRLRVMRAYLIQQERNRFDADGRDNGFVYNGRLSHKQLQKICKLSSASRELLARAVSQLGLSARAYDRIIRLARTIADLEGHIEISASDIAESIKYRTLARAC